MTLQAFNEFKSGSRYFNQSTHQERQNYLHLLKSLLVKSEPDIFLAFQKDFDKPEFEVLFTELYPVYKEIDFFVKHLKSWMKIKRVPTPFVFSGSKSYTQVLPKGCVLILSPWNYPLQLLLSPLVAAIGAGNTVVLKPSELTPNVNLVLKKILSHPEFSKIIRFEEGGVSLANELLDLPFDHIFFTGSTRVGKIVMEKAAKHLASVTLELGGKSPVIVDQSVDLKRAAQSITWGKYLNAGQTCVAPDYVYVHESQKEAFLKEVQQSWSTFSASAHSAKESGYTSLITKDHKARLENWIEQAKPQAQVQRVHNDKFSSESKLPLTIVTGSLKGLDLDQQEIFGPILPIKTYYQIETVFSDLQAQDSPLALYIFSESSKFIDQVLKNTRSGGVCVNDVILHLANPFLPFGGQGASGLGSYHGYFGFQQFSHERAIFKESRLFGRFKFFYPPYRSLQKQIVRFLIKWL